MESLSRRHALEFERSSLLQILSAFELSSSQLLMTTCVRLSSRCVPSCCVRFRTTKMEGSDPILSFQALLLSHTIAIPLLLPDFDAGLSRTDSRTSGVDTESRRDSLCSGRLSYNLAHLAQ